jgi:hypothetical protein
MTGKSNAAALGGWIVSAAAAILGADTNSQGLIRTDDTMVLCH